MQKHLSKWLCLLLGISLSLPLFAQADGATQVFGRVQNSILRAGDGQNNSWGLYLAGSRNKKFIFVLATADLNVGLEKRIQLTLLTGKNSAHEAEQMQTNADLGVAVYRVERSPKDGDLDPITTYPGNKQISADSLWIPGNPDSPEQLQQVRGEGSAEGTAFFTIHGILPENGELMPVFSSGGEIAGIMAIKNTDGSYQCIPTEKLIKFAVETLAGEDLFPTWKELYPSRYAIEKVLASSAILLTEKPGTGFFIGRDQDDTGYLLTANHVVQTSPGAAVDSFNVYFFQDQVNPTWGSVVPQTQDTVLDMAVVKVRKCPAVPPMTILRTSDLEKIEKAVLVPTVANVGLALESNEEYGFFEFETGKIEKAGGDRTIHTNLPVISGHSGGPVFNENGEIVGITLKTELSETGDTLSVANHNRTILQYFDTHLKQIDFKEKWQFLQKPSWWKRNQMWLLSGGAAVAAGTTALLLRSNPEIDPIGDGGPSTPTGGGQQ